MFNRNSYKAIFMDFGLNSAFLCCIGLEFSYKAIFMDFGHIPVLEYCFGLNSAILTEWDSIQCSCTALILNIAYWSLIQQYY